MRPCRVSLPFRSGEVARVHYASQRSGFGVERQTTFASVSSTTILYFLSVETLDPLSITRSIYIHGNLLPLGTELELDCPLIVSGHEFVRRGRKKSVSKVIAAFRFFEAKHTM